MTGDENQQTEQEPEVKRPVGSLNVSDVADDVEPAPEFTIKLTNVAEDLAPDTKDADAGSKD